MIIDRMSANEIRKLLNIVERRLEAARKDFEQAPTNMALMLAKNSIDELLRQYAELTADLERIESSVSEPSLSIVGSTSGSWLPSPNNIPAQRPPFVGRRAEQNAVLELLAGQNPVVVISGFAGTGKTALAKSICRSVLNNGSFGAVIWLSAKDRSLTAADVIDTAAEVLGIYPAIQDIDFGRRLMVVADALKRRNSLLVLDNVSLEPDSAFVQTESGKSALSVIDSLPESVKILITSRERLDISCVEYPLSTLSPDDGIEFLKRFTYHSRYGTFVQPNSRQMTALYHTSGGLPLAMLWAMGQIERHGQTIDAVLSDLQDARGKIFELLFGTISLELNETSRKVLIALSLLPGPATQGLLLSATNLQSIEVNTALDQLVGSWLVDPSSAITVDKRRYELHPLTRAFALGLDCSPEERLQVLRRAADYYKGVMKHRLLLAPAFVREELAQALSLANKLEEREEYEAFQLLVAEIANPLEKYGLMQERLDFSKRAISAARALGNREAEAWHAVFSVAHCLTFKNELEDAERYIAFGLQVAEETGNKKVLAISLQNEGRTLRHRKRYAEAQDKLEKALAIWEELGDPYWHTVGKLALSSAASRNGDFDRAFDLLTRAHDEAIAQGDDELESIALGLLGRLALGRGDSAGARTYYLKALELCERIGRVSGEPHGYLGLAKAVELDNSLVAAEHWYIQARRGFVELRMLAEAEECNEAILRLRAGHSEKRRKVGLADTAMEGPDEEQLDIEAIFALTTAAYDEIAEVYSQRWDSFHNNEAMDRFSSLFVNGSRILDVGCGTGRDIKLLEEREFQCVGVDISTSMLMVAQRNGCFGEICLGDVRDLPFPDKSFAGAWASACLLHFPRSEAQTFFMELGRVTQSVMFVSVVEGEGNSWSRTPRGAARYFEYYSREELTSMFHEINFEIVEMWNPNSPDVYPKWLYSLAVRRE